MRVGPSRAALVAATVLAVTSAAAQPAKRDVATEIVNIPLDIRLPVGSCAVPNALEAIAFALRIPVGIEKLPGRCTPGPRQDADAKEVVKLQAMTVAQAMNQLVKIDPRYYWTESEGVVSVRPVEAWADRDHFLHRTFDGLRLENANIGEALHRALAVLIDYSDFGDRLMNGVGEVTVTTGAISVVEALDAIVRAEGSSFWQVEYCRPERSAATATVGIYTFGKRGLGARLPKFYQRDVEGRLIDPCRAP